MSIICTEEATWEVGNDDQLIMVKPAQWSQLGDGLRLKGLCPPCTEGVYRPLPLLTAMAQNARRAQEWSNIILTDDSNGYPRTSQFMRSNPLKGAYGEVL